MFLLRDVDDQTGALIEACQRPTNPQCEPLCDHVSGNNSFLHCELHTDKDGYLRLHVGYQNHCPGGRRPARVRFDNDRGRSMAGLLLSRSCQLEAASVPAFIQLADQLRTYGAPARLEKAAQRAARDEIRHARVMRRLAARYGANAGVPNCPVPPQAPSLSAIALLNEREGCVRESYAALVAAHQGAMATDKVVRKAMARIAADELRHASLSRAIQTWIKPQLTVPQRAALTRARKRELALLRTATSVPAPADVQALLGLPTPATSARIIDLLAAEVA